MGLGKTVQTLALLLHRAALGPALVIAPISVTPGWISEAARFAPGLRVLPYRGTNREALLSGARPGDLFIAGYGVVTRDPDALAGVRFSTLVLDEAHSIKNSATRRARAVGRLQADFRVALTGTPVENHLGELWNLFRVISPGLLGTWPQFRERFAAPIERDQSAERRAALGRVLRPFMLRRTKETVLPELPPLIELNRLVSLSAAEREVYETAPAWRQNGSGSECAITSWSRSRPTAASDATEEDAALGAGIVPRRAGLKRTPPNDQSKKFPKYRSDWIRSGTAPSEPIHDTHEPHPFHLPLPRVRPCWLRRPRSVRSRGARGTARRGGAR